MYASTDVWWRSRQLRSPRRVIEGIIHGGEQLLMLQGPSVDSELIQLYPPAQPEERLLPCDAAIEGDLEFTGVVIEQDCSNCGAEDHHWSECELELRDSDAPIRLHNSTPTGRYTA